MVIDSMTQYNRLSIIAQYIDSYRMMAAIMGHYVEAPLPYWMKKSAGNDGQS